MALRRRGARSACPFLRLRRLGASFFFFQTPLRRGGARNLSTQVPLRRGGVENLFTKTPLRRGGVSNVISLFAFRHGFFPRSAYAHTSPAVRRWVRVMGLLFGLTRSAVGEGGFGGSGARGERGGFGELGAEHGDGGEFVEAPEGGGEDAKGEDGPDGGPEGGGQEKLFGHVGGVGVGVGAVDGEAKEGAEVFEGVEAGLDGQESQGELGDGEGGALAEEDEGCAASDADDHGEERASHAQVDKRACAEDACRDLELLAFGAQPVGDEAGELVALFGFALHQVEGREDQTQSDGDGPGRIRASPKDGGGDGDNAQREEGFGDQAHVARQQDQGRAEGGGA